MGFESIVRTPSWEGVYSEYTNVKIRHEYISKVFSLQATINFVNKDVSEFITL